MGLKQKVFGRITGHGKRRKRHYVSSGIFGSFDGIDYQSGIAGNIADGRVNLCQGNSKHGDVLYTHYFLNAKAVLGLALAILKCPISSKIKMSYFWLLKSAGKNFLVYFCLMRTRQPKQSPGIVIRGRPA